MIKLIYLFICCLVCVTQSASPTVTKSTPSFFVNKGPFNVNLSGTGFKVGLTVECNGVSLSYVEITDTLITNITVTDVVAQAADVVPIPTYFFRVTTDEGHVDYTVYGITVPTMQQTNENIIVTSKGLNQIPIQRFAIGSRGSYQVVIPFSDTMCTGKVNSNMIRYQEVSVYDDSTLVYTERKSWSPRHTGWNLYDTYVIVLGYYFSNYTSMVVDNYPATFVSTDGTSIKFELPKDFFMGTIPYYTVQTFTLPTPDVPTQSDLSFNSYARTIISRVTHSKPNYVALTVNYLQSGTPMQLYSLNSSTFQFSSVNTTVAVFSYTAAFKCDLYYIGYQSGPRASSSIVICPIPELLSIYPRPDPIEGGNVTVTGTYINTDLFDGSRSTTFTIDYQDGSDSTQCTQDSVYDPSNLMYTLKCSIPPGKGKFTFTAKGLKDASSTISYEYSINIDKVSSIPYGKPGTVNITGSGFTNTNLNVMIGQNECVISKVSDDGSYILCIFSADVNPSDSNRLEVVVDNDGVEASSTFSYNCTQSCSGHGECIILQDKCNCDKGWNTIDNCSTVSPIIKSVSSTKYGTPAEVTIVGENFVNFNLFVSIGGSECTNPTVSQDLTTITCLFQSDVFVQSYEEILDVYISINTIFTTTKNLFLYTNLQSCPIGTNGHMCSGHGTCNQQYQCVCDKDWQTIDCSIKDTGVIVEPIDSSSSTNNNNSTDDSSINDGSGCHIPNWKSAVIILCLVVSALITL